MSHRGGFSAIAAMIVALFALATTVKAQDAEDPEERLAAEIMACRMIDDPTERLHCYDEAVGASAEKAVVETEGVELQLAGEGDFDSENFVVDEPWHLRWESEGSILTVELRDMAGELLGIIGNQIGQGDGRSDVEGPGEYQLAVRAIGSWRLWVMREE